MKNRIVVLVILAIGLSASSCDKSDLKHYELSLQPDATSGLDALAFDLNPESNYGTHPDFIAVAWTNGNTPVRMRAFIKFDFSGIPDDAIIESVKLSLFSYLSPINGGHSPLSGSNSCLLQRVTSAWGESTLNWNNQPSTTTNNQVTLPQSQYENQHYLNIDVTDMARDMIKNPSTNFGFMLKLETEEFYRRMTFASSDNDNPALRPKIDISYSIEK